MSTSTPATVRRTHIVIPQQLATEIDSLVGKRGRSAFLTQAAEKELLRLRQIKAIKAATGTWKDKDHPELKQGAAKWVNKLRREYDQRFERVTAR
jgi:metal-responsive CopG/Arc/MetJ family transcriptional regulator